MKRLLVGGVCLAVIAVTTVAIAGGDWSGSKDKAERFKSEYENLRKLTPQETKRVVTAICEASEDDRKSVASDVHSRVASLIDDKFDDLQDLKDETLKKLDEVLSDDALKDKHSDAKSWRSDTQRRWETIDRMTRSIRGKNHPVVRYLINKGNEEHRNRQTSSSYCDVYEYTDLSSGRPDCIRASDCTVVELKPDNSRAISKGRGQASRYARELNDSADKRKKLAEKDSDFAKCEKFDSEVQCYKLCPDIDSDTNEMESTSVSWRSELMPSIVAAFRYQDSPRERANALAGVLTSPPLGALTRTWYAVKDQDKAHTNATSEAVAERLTNPEAHAVGLDSGRTGDLVAKAMVDVALPYTPDADVVAPLHACVIVPYDRSTADGVVEAIVSIAEILRPVWGMLSVEPTFDVADMAALAKGPPRDQRSQFPHITEDRIRYRRAPWFHDKKIDQGIGGPEWGTFLGPRHVEKLSVDTLRSSMAFAKVRALPYGGVYLQLSGDPGDATTDKIVGLVKTGRSVLEPILLDVSTIKL